MASRSLGTLTLDLVANTGGFSSGMDRAGRIADKRTREIERQMKERAAAIDKAFSTVAKGLVSAFAAIKFVDAIKGAADFADRLSKLSQRTGDTVEQLSRLQYAASLNDATADELGNGLRALAKNMADTAAGTGEARSAFEALGLTQDIQNGRFKTAGALFTEVAGRLSKFADGANKSAIAQKIFGDAGVRLIPLLNNGADGIKAMGDEGERFGVVIGTDMAKASAEFNDNLTRFNALSQGLSITLGNELIPVVNKLAGELLDAQAAGLGFFDLFVRNGQAALTTAQNLARVEKQIADLNSRPRNAVTDRLESAGLLKGDDELEALKRQRDYLILKLRREQDQGAAAPPAARANAPALKLPTSTAKGKGDGGDALGDFITPIMERSKAYEDAMRRFTDLQDTARASSAQLTEAQRLYLELINSPDWGLFTDAQRDTIDTYFQQADAIEQAYANQERLNALIEATPTGRLEAQREQMQFLADAFERGVISAQQYAEVVNTTLGNTAPTVDALQTKFLDLATVANDGARMMGQAFADFATGAETDFGKLVVAFLKGIAQMIAQSLALLAIQMILGVVSGGTSIAANMASGAASGAMSGAMKNAKGGVYGSPSLSAYSGSVVDRPTFFKFAKGGSLGVMGEAGAEAIMPLKRGPDGKLGVAATGGGGAQINQTFNVTVEGGGDEEAGQRQGDAIAKRLRVEMKAAAMEVLMNEKRPGGVLS